MKITMTRPFVLIGVIVLLAWLPTSCDTAQKDTIATEEHKAVLALDTERGRALFAENVLFATILQAVIAEEVPYEECAMNEEILLERLKVHCSWVSEMIKKYEPDNDSVILSCDPATWEHPCIKSWQGSVESLARTLIDVLRVQLDLTRKHVYRCVEGQICCPIDPDCP